MVVFARSIQPSFHRGQEVAVANSLLNPSVRSGFLSPLALGPGRRALPMEEQSAPVIAIPQRPRPSSRH
jgi:hypothetical protein